MTSKGQAHRSEKADARQRPLKPAHVKPDRAVQPQNHPALIIQRARLDPASLSANDVGQLQRTLGNQSVRRLMAQAARHQPVQKTNPALPIQAKLMVGPPNDRYEQEADQVASQVVQQINAPAPAQPAKGQPLQRQEEPEEEMQMKRDVSALQRSSLLPTLQREAVPEEENLQAKSLLQPQEAVAGGQAAPDLESAINSARGGGQLLDAGLQRSMGQAMGADFSGVRVHTDAQADRLNQAVQAKAFTTGQDLFFRQGMYEPGSRAGQELIAHELTHVVQQSGERPGNETALNAKTENGQVLGGIVQRALWTNSAAKFRTDNENPAIPNSEYKVSGNRYMRYAPINKTRALEQIFHDEERSFVYIRGTDTDGPDYDAIWEKPIFVTSVSGGQVKFKTGKSGFEDSPEVTGYIAPTPNATVFDFGVNDSTGQLDPDSHVGHPVEDLGQPLPTLDDPDALQAARDYQHFLLEQFLMLREKGIVSSYKEWNQKSLGK